MKIQLNDNDVAWYGDLLEALTESIDEADTWNDLMNQGITLPKKGIPYPVKELSAEPFEKNPYYQTVRPQAKKWGNLSLEYDSYRPGQGFVYDEIVIDPKTFGEHTPFGYFPTSFRFLALKQYATTWMSVTPHEINTMKKPIEEAKGNVVTLGLGLGYYAFMVANKDDVTSVTVIEKDPQVIALFRESILPFFPNGAKIKIIQADALQWCQTPYEADFLFADLWHLPEDGLPLYSQLVTHEKDHPNTIFSYWIEDSMLTLIRRAVMVLIDEEMLESVDENYRYAETFSDALINQIHFLLKEVKIHSRKEIYDLLSKDSLKRIAARLKF